MTTDNKTLADVKPGGRVRLGDQAAATVWAAMQEAGYLFSAEPFAEAHPDDQEKCRRIAAAISAQPSPATCKEGLQVQPSPGGQGDSRIPFEAWAKDGGFDVSKFKGIYNSIETRAAWEAWLYWQRLAARQPVCGTCTEAIRPDALTGTTCSCARQPVGEPGEMSPEFTDTARAAIAWVLWHHQGGSSPVGQPLRFALGMGQHDRMTDHQIAEAKRFAAWANATTEDFQHRAPAQAVDLGALVAELAEADREYSEAKKKYYTVSAKSSAAGGRAACSAAYQREVTAKARLDAAVRALIDSQAVGK